MAERISLDGEWQFKGYYGEDWLGRGGYRPGSRDRRGWMVARVPGSVQHDLWQCGEISDPYFERNSLLCEWVPERTWLYRRTFRVGEEQRGKRLRLRFDGVDYQAQFFLNGERLGDHSSMYTPALFDVTGQVKVGEENLLAVLIEPAPDEQPQIGRTSRVRTHKSRMTYWWDFCPRMVHLGIWDSVWLESSGPFKIEDVCVRPQLAGDHSQAEVTVSARLSSILDGAAEVETAILTPSGHRISQADCCTFSAGESAIDVTFSVENPELWWPNGMGVQPLYRAEVQVYFPDQQLSDRQEVHFGIRRIEFEANETADDSARPYTLVANGRRAFIKGWNWVPLDVMYGVERPEKLSRLLRLAREAHVNMLRVWGGGLVEKEAFYDLCDRLGILVWQEFIQSSSGVDNIPPEDPQFIDFMVEEARQIIPRRRNHPSLAVWCGGNELQAGPERPVDESHPMIAALAGVVGELDPGRYWLPTSPSGPVFSNSLENIERRPDSLHDVHGPWEHQGLEGQPALYNRGSSLLHSEFGVEGITNLPTLNRVISPDHQVPVSLDNPVWHHLGAWWVKEPAWKAAFDEIESMESLVRAVQFWQADGLRYAVEADRRRKYQNSGTLPWQFNEPYPMAACTSAVDYYAQPKPAYYAVASAYAPVHLSARFPVQAWGGRPLFQVEVWVSNSSQEVISGAVLDAALVGAGGRRSARWRREAAFGPDAATKLASLEWQLSDLEEDIFFLDLVLTGRNGVQLSTNRYIFSRTSNLAPMLAIPRTSLEAYADRNGDRWTVRLTNTGDQTALYIWLQDESGPMQGGAYRPGGQANTGQATAGQISAYQAPGYLYLSDNHFCLFPGESRTLEAAWENIISGQCRIALAGWNTPRITL